MNRLLGAVPAVCVFWRHLFLGVGLRQAEGCKDPLFVAELQGVLAPNVKVKQFQEVAFVEVVVMGNGRVVFQMTI